MQSAAPAAVDLARVRDKDVPENGVRRESGEERAAWSVQSAVTSAQGPRPTMEDRHTLVDDGWAEDARNKGASLPGTELWPRAAFYACFDGHGGSRAAALSSRLLWAKLQSRLMMHFQEEGSGPESSSGGTLPNLIGGLLDMMSGRAKTAWLEEVIRQSFAECESDICTQAQRAQWHDGCTAVAALLLGQYLVIGNLGDSRAVLFSGGEAIRLSEDHKPSTEKERQRIKKAGGRVVVLNGISRVPPPIEGVYGGLSLSRAFGDIAYKRLPPLPRASASPDGTAQSSKSPARTGPTGAQVGRGGGRGAAGGARGRGAVGTAGGRGGAGRGRVAPNSSAGTTPPNGTSSTPLGEGEAFDWKSANNVTFDQPKLGFTVQGFTVPGNACGEVRVTAVERGSLAEQRGVGLGDVLLACNGMPFAGIP